MRGAGRKTVVAALSLFALGITVLSAPEAMAQDNTYIIPGEGFGTGVYIDGRSPIDSETRDKVDAYLEGYRRRQNERREWLDRMKNHQYGNLVSRSRSQGRY